MTPQHSAVNFTGGVLALFFTAVLLLLNVNAQLHIPSPSISQYHIHIEKQTSKTLPLPTQSPHLPLISEMADHDICHQNNTGFSIPASPPPTATTPKTSSHPNVHSFTFQQLQFSTFQKKCERVRAPDDGSTGLLYICPKGGPVIRPVEPRSPQQHFCFANRIMGYLVQGFDNAPSLPGNFFTTLSPATPYSSSSSITGSSSSAVPHYYNRDHLGSPRPNGQTPSTVRTSISSGSNILASPITRYQNRDRSASPHPVQYRRRPRSPSQRHQRSQSSSPEILHFGWESHSPSTPDDSQAASPSTHAPSVPFTSVDIHDLSDLSHAIHVSADLDYSTSTLHFEADTLNDATDGLINVLKHCYVQLTNQQDSEPLSFINPVPDSTFSTYRGEHLTNTT
ncbi:hypothetical protein BDR03DRAFT_1018547 [Suillus americanus]|nr:hypothetical protein BDR03DRAFT_1018547 [Suillus americanus]